MAASSVEPQSTGPKAPGPKAPGPKAWAAGTPPVAQSFEQA